MDKGKGARGTEQKEDKELQDMKLQEALKQAIVQFSASVLGEKRLVYLISDRQGFDDFPAMKQVFDTIVSGNSGKELSSLAIGGKKDEFIRYADGLRKSLVSSQHFKQEFADFAADSLIFALGWGTDVKEPSDHGFDPLDRKSSAVSPRGHVQQGSKSLIKLVVIGAASAVLLLAVILGFACSPSEVEKLTEAANNGDAEAAYTLAGLYASGSGVGQDQKKAAELYRSAAEKGHAKAQLEMGNAYSEGKGVTKSDKMAAVWWKKAADQGDMNAQYALGKAYAEGRGVPQNYGAATVFFNKAANKGNKQAEAALGDGHSKDSGAE